MLSCEAGSQVRQEGRQRHIRELCLSVHALHDSQDASGHASTSCPALPEINHDGEKRCGEEDNRPRTGQSARRTRGEAGSCGDASLCVLFWEAEICRRHSSFFCCDLIRMRQTPIGDGVQTWASNAGREWQLPDIALQQVRLLPVIS